MVSHITIAKVSYPVKFGLKAELMLERQHGVTFGVDHLGTEMSVRLFHYGLQVGAEIEKKPLELTFDQLIEELDKDQSIIAAFREIMTTAYAEKKN